MKTLILIRHAKAEAASKTRDDMDRPLTPLGRRDAAAMAEQLKEFDLTPALLVSSPALRAMQTAEIFAAAFSLEVQPDERLYGSGADDLLHTVRGLKNSCGTVMVVGHHPALQDLLHKLTGRRFCDVPPAAVAAVHVPSGSWRRAGSGRGTLSFSFTPRQGPLQRAAGGPAVPGPMVRMRIWSMQNRSKLIGIIMLMIGLLLLAGIVPFILRSSIDPAGRPQQGGQN